MKTVTATFTFQVEDDAAPQVGEVLGDAYAQIEDAVLRDEQGNETRFPTYNLELTYDIV